MKNEILLSKFKSTAHIYQFCKLTKSTTDIFKFLAMKWLAINKIAKPNDK